MNKTILSIDTSMQACSVALLINDHIDYLYEESIKNHTKKILTMIQNILIRNKLLLKKVDLCAITKGPGTFTGIRTGICIATGLSIGSDIPVITFSTLEILAEQAWRVKKIKKLIIAIKLNKKLIYWNMYIRKKNGLWEKQTKEFISTHQELYNQILTIKSDWTRIGDGWKNINLNYNIPNIKYIKIIQPHAQDIIILSKNFLKNNPFPINTIIQPDYFCNYFES
ncbi:tRNA threonylcarbamoyladenosine biosynthesis protein TsaB [Buchnera aphidicola (Eriosoma grossulariae)]|uniref:tRNA (adenosine(37)-N6)-threonylcarbamoyltransferase complex dimerization subunit type 1 TsaB n=1 Tax=Buchnera aphidicola TaxID=9 RepID=UPI003464517C